MHEWSEASGKIIPLIIILIVLYILSIISMTIYTQLMAVITQGFLSKLRCRMFDGMQNLPIGYFDTHKHGDIMSYYTNDIDTLQAACLAVSAPASAVDRNCSLRSRNHALV